MTQNPNKLSHYARNYGLPLIVLRTEREILRSTRGSTWGRDTERLAGVENYRWERTTRDRKTKRPYLVRHGAPLAPMLERWHLLTPIPASMMPTR